MKKLTIAISTILLSTSVFAANETTPATTADTATKVDMTKVSYLIGRGMGEQLSKGKVDLDQKSFDKGLESALAGEKSDISKKESMTIMMAFQKEMVAKMKTLQKEVAATNLKDANNFATAISKVKGVKKVSDGVYIQTLTEGNGQQPAKNDTVTVNYRGTTPAQAYAKDTTGSLKTIEEGNLIGEQFDSSYDRGQPATFPLSNVVKCWQEAIPQMKVGSKAIVYCSPNTAYGSTGNQNIAPNQLLSFQVELLKVDSKASAKK